MHRRPEVAVVDLWWKGNGFRLDSLVFGGEGACRGNMAGCGLFISGWWSSMEPRLCDPLYDRSSISSVVSHAIIEWKNIKHGRSIDPFHLISHCCEIFIIIVNCLTRHSSIVLHILPDLVRTCPVETVPSVHWSRSRTRSKETQTRSADGAIPDSILDLRMIVIHCRIISP